MKAVKFLFLGTVIKNINQVNILMFFAIKEICLLLYNEHYVVWLLAIQLVAIIRYSVPL